MNFFRIKDLRLLVMIPTVVVVTIILLLAINRTRQFMSQQTDFLVENIMNSNAESLDGFVTRNINSLRLHNYIISEMGFVQKAYENYARFANYTISGNILQDSLTKIHEKNPVKSYYEYQFSLAKGVLLYRSSDNTIGRYKDEVEQALSSVLTDKEDRYGFELGRQGVYLKAIQGVWRGDRFMGAVETHLNIEQLLKNYHSEFGSKASFFVERAAIPSVYLPELEFLKEQTINDAYFVIHNDISDFSEGELEEIIRDHPSQKNWFHKTSKKIFEFNIVRDMTGSKIGYWITEHSIDKIILLHDEIKRIQRVLIPVIIIALSAFLYLLLTHLITRPLSYINNRVQAMLNGLAVKPYATKRKDDIYKILHSLNELENRNISVAQFADSIGSGRLDDEYTTFGEGDILGRSLLEMRSRLLKADEAAKKQHFEEQKQAWVSDGIAQFAEVLRKNIESIQQLGDEVLSFLVSYLDVVQGAVYIREVNSGDEDKVHLELLAAYAYQQKRYFRKQIELGEGPIGTCAAEKETIYLRNVPTDHIKITSGLGELEPRVILLEPLLMNNELYGVLEINSFAEIEKYQIEFIQKATESFAATLANVRINIQTRRLLLQYQQQSDELAKQEEQMRQNLEQMLATQEDALYKERRMTSLFDSLDIALIRLELNIDGMILSANLKFFEITGRLSEDVLGKHLSSFLDVDSREFANHAILHNTEYETYYCQLVLTGKFAKRSVVQTVFTPVVGDTGNVESLQLLALPV